MPLNKPITDYFMRLWGKVISYEFTRTLRAKDKRMEYIGKTLAYIDRVENRLSKWMTNQSGRETTENRYTFVILLVVLGIVLSVLPFLLLK